MRWVLRPRFGLRTLLIVVLLGALASYYYINTGSRYREAENARARKRIDAYELAMANEACGGQVPGELVAILGESRLGHWGPVFRVKVLAGDRVASHAPDEVARVWDSKSGKQIASFPAAAIGASGDRKMLFVAQPGNIVQYDVATLRPLAKIPLESPWKVGGISANRDGNILAWQQSLQHSQTRKNIVWDIARQQAIFELSTTYGGAIPVLTSNGDKLVYVDDGQIVVHKLDGISSDVRRARITDQDGRSSYAIYSLALSKEEDVVFAGSALPGIVAFDLATGREAYRSSRAKQSVSTVASWADRRQVVHAQEGNVYFSSVSPLGFIQLNFIATGYDRVNCFDCGSRVAIGHGNFISLYDSNEPHAACRMQNGAPQRIGALVFDPRSRWVFTGDNEGVITCWKIGSWKPLRSWKAHERGINYLSITREGSRLASVSEDNLAVIWDTATNAEICSAPAGKKAGVCFSSDGREFICSEPQMGSNQPLAIYETETGALLRKIGSLSDYPHGQPAWSLDGKHVAMTSVYRSSVDLLDANTGTMKGTWGKGPIDNIKNVPVWYRDSNRLLASAWNSGDLHVLQVGKPTPLIAIKVGGSPSHAALHPSERFAAVCGQRTPVQIWDLQRSKLVKSWQIGPPEGSLSAVSFSPDGNYLATVNSNGTAYVLSLDGVLPE